MSDFFGGLFIFAIVLAVVAVVGHLVYLAAAASVRALLGLHQDRRTVRCPSCNRNLQLSRGKCMWCGCAVRLPQAMAKDEAAAEFEKQLGQLLKRGALDLEQFQKLVQEFRAGLQPAWLPTSESSSIVASAKSIAASATANRVQTGGPADHPIAAPATASQAETPTSISREGAAACIEAKKTAPASGGPALGDVLRAFMDENNIRWGELISGLLIVGSSIGLVISLWATLKEAIPYFPALLFMIVTAAIHGAGLYTLHRWNLKSTSRGLLIISVFLIPLNYLAAVALSDRRPTTDLLFLAAMATGLGVFAAMSYFAGRKLLLAGWWLLPIGVIGASAGQVVISRLAAPDMALGKINLLFFLPLASFLATTLGQLQIATRWPRLTVRRATQIFLVTAVAVFAVAVAAGILLWKTEAPRLTLAQLSPSLSILGASILGVGEIVHVRLTATKLAAWRTAGTSIAVAGATLMVACVLLAWPRPELLVGVGIVNFAALTLLALALGIAPMHVPALLGLALAGLVGFHLSLGHLVAGLDSRHDRLIGVLLWGQSAMVLLVFSAAAAAASFIWRRLARVAQSRAYARAALVPAVLGNLVAGNSGFLSGVDGPLATWVFAASAVAVLAIDQRRQNSGLGWCGSALLLAALVHALGWNETIASLLDKAGWLPARPMVVALLLHATIMTALGFLLPSALKTLPAGKAADRKRRGFVEVRSHSALVTSLLALPLVLMAFDDPLALRSGYGFWIAGLWFAFAALHKSPELFGAAQGLASLALGAMVTAICQRQTWWSDVFWQPAHIYSQMGAFAVWSMFWVGIRRLLRTFANDELRNAAVQLDGAHDEGGAEARGGSLISDHNHRTANFWQPTRPAIDQIILAVVIAGLPLFVALACAPSAASELQVVTPVSLFGGFGWFFAIVIFALSGAMCVSFGGALKQGEAAVPLAVACAIPLAALFAPSVLQAAEGFWAAVGATPAEVFTPGAWVVAGLVAVALAISLAERISPMRLYGALWLLLVVPLLVAGPFAAQNATASALRWGMAFYGVLVGFALVNFTRLQSAARRLGWTSPAAPSPQFRGRLGFIALVLTMAPLLTMSLDTLVPEALDALLRG
ncbi:MAG TPA: hypothetical protein VKU82_03805, partial [Planctomycetaceae bacterium]|nr:hypothetical protein [Planctomycetaceae bacterium]